MDFTTNLARQCRAFSRALKIEKLKAPATNDWCITFSMYVMKTLNTISRNAVRHQVFDIDMAVFCFEVFQIKYSKYPDVVV